MPISSGAEGRVDVGIDTSIAWTPDGVKKEAKPVKNCDSYLRRHLESQAWKKEHNSTILGQDTSQHRAGPDGENMDTFSPGVSRDPNTQQKNGGSDEGKASGKQTNEKSSKKSQTCTLL